MPLSFSQIVGAGIGFALDSILQTLPFWLPIILGYLLAWLWLYYVRAKFIKNLQCVLLEIKMPREIRKSPKAMEVALGAFYQTWDGDNLLIGNWLQGQLRAWFSLELVSLNGEIHFYIWTQKFFRNLVESQLYAQYPGVEIFEVEDYTNKMPYGLPARSTDGPESDWKLWGAEFTLSKEDAYPIKTYVSYGLEDAGAKEEEKVDPMTATLEYLGTLKPGEQMWVQILVQATRQRFKKAGTWFGKQDWRGDSQALIEKLMKRDQAKLVGEEGGSLGSLLLSPGERKVVEEIERSVSKLGFDVGIRVIYFAKGKLFNPLNVAAISGLFKQYNSLDLNGFKIKRKTSIEYPWEDPTGRRIVKLKAIMFDAYRRRSYFYPPYRRQPFVLNTEELATIYHFPGQVATTPSLQKIESKRGEPPPGLPI